MIEATPKAKYRSDYTKPAFLVTDLHLTFELIESNTKVTQIANYVLNDESVNELTLDGVEQKLLTVEVNGQHFTDYTVSDTSLTLNNLPEQFELKIETEIDPKNNSSLEGLYLSDGAYCTQCEAEGFRKITYFQDRPDVLTTYTVKVIADKAFPYLLSNGNKVEEGELSDGRHFAVWHDPHKKPCYLFALVAGDFDLLEDSFTTKSGREVALQLFVDKGNLDKAPHAMTSLIKSMAWDEQRFNLEYDLDIYMIVAVDFFNMGAMENKGLNIFNSRCVLANQNTATDRDFHTIESIIGHEYFHNWTGNRVTCQDWFQLSLKEGLTVFRDQEFSSDVGSRAINRIDAVKVIRTHQFAEDAGPMAHPIRPDKVIEMNNFYTVTVYNKGAEVIRMIHTLLGEAGFMAGMALYFERHDGTAATCDDFVNAMMDASKVDLTQFKRWYSQSGTPTIKASVEYREHDNQLLLTLSQHHKTEQANLHIPVSIELLNKQGNQIALVNDGESIDNVLSLTEGQQTYCFDSVEELGAVTLLENFSAPCKLDFEQHTDALVLQVKHARSDFTRWDAMQTLLIQQVKSAIACQDGPSSAKLNEQVIELLKTLILMPSDDYALTAELLKLPSFDTLAADYAVIPVDAINDVLDAFEMQIATSLETELMELYQRMSESGDTTAQDVSARAIKSIALHYLAKTNSPAVKQLIQEQFNSSNMNNCLSALASAVHGKHDLEKSLLNQFKEKWQQDVLVMDKWLALNAQRSMTDIYSHIESLYQEPFFDVRNPNRVRSLLSTFAMFNTRAFHDISGQGYELLTNMLIRLNDINPQNASRMLTPLLGYKQLDEKRQALVKAQLTRLQQLENLSPDLFEKLNNALS